MEIYSLESGVRQGLQQRTAVFLWHTLRGFFPEDGVVVITAIQDLAIRLYSI